MGQNDARCWWPLGATAPARTPPAAIAVETVYRRNKTRSDFRGTCINERTSQHHCACRVTLRPYWASWIKLLLLLLPLLLLPMVMMWRRDERLGSQSFSCLINRTQICRHHSGYKQHHFMQVAVFPADLYSHWIRPTHEHVPEALFVWTYLMCKCAQFMYIHVLRTRRI